MLADPRHSCIVLANVTRTAPAGVTETFALRRVKSLSLLSVCRDNFAVPTIVIGEYEKAVLPVEFIETVSHLHIETFALWHDRQFADVLAKADVTNVFLGGAFLDEEILIAALEGAKRGHDVRILSDLTIARQDADRDLVLDRLAHHGVIATTVSQMLLEWSVSLNDSAVIEKVQQLLF